MGSVAVPVEVLSESEHTRVVRVRLPAGTAIRKEPLGPDRLERVSHEVAILRRLSGIDHVAQLAPEQPDDGSILLNDIRGQSLAREPMPTDMPWLVRLSLALAHVIAAIHERGVVHCDISPGNIIIGDDGSPYLVDFALAMTVAELRPEFAHPNEIVGTLPYLAPEQTGRTGRSVDRRADLYGLGATMYELATGRPPFGTGDPLRLIHDHLARAPVPPSAVNPAMPATLSDIVMHLLAKEPDSRYQTAEGLIRDLERVRDGATRLAVGADDVPLRLTEPSRLVGRDKEVHVLKEAFEGALRGECRGVVICGAPGVGKSALLEELRPIVTAGDGWFASGRFDRYRRDREHDGVAQALRGLGRLLLAEPEDTLVDVRQRLLQSIGPNAGMAAAVLPEFGTLLRVRPDPGDPLTAQVRAQRTALAILRSVASRKRPVVFAIDNLQWGGATPLGLIDQLLTGEEEVEGLVTVVAYRDTEVHETDPLGPLLPRWKGRPEHLRLENLDRGSLIAMVAEMLHAPTDVVCDLAVSIFELTSGNPHETVELLNALRREDVLRPTGSGWWWDPAAIAKRLARQNVAQVMRARVDRMPVAARRVLEAMACLGNEVRLDVLRTATKLSSAAVQQRLGPAFEDGLLVMGSGLRTVRFHHDRLRDIVLSAIGAPRLRALRLLLARRLATRPELFAAAAEQYLPVVDAVHDPEERHRAAAMLREAASQNMWIGESLPAERMLAAAVQLADSRESRITLNVSRQTALVRLGRLDEADEVYQAVVRESTTPYDRIEAARTQISSLTNRNRPQEAIELGLDLLNELGWAVPAADEIDAEIERGLDWSTSWIHETSEEDDLRRPDVTDPIILSAGSLMSRMMPACFFRDKSTMAWLALAAARVWAEQGPARTLVGVIGHLPWALVGRRGAYGTGHRLIRRLLAVGEDRGFEPDTSQARFLDSLGVSHWFNPLEETVAEAPRAREGLVRGGDLQAACYTFCAPVYAVELAPSVNDYATEVETAAAFAAKTGNEHAAGLFQPYQWLVAALRGESANGAEMVDRLAEPVAAANANVARALAAAIFDQPETLAWHSAAAMELRHAVEATYASWQAHLVRAMALADRVRGSADSSPDLAELDDIIGWMAQRAADAPLNFRHMVSLVEAERAWALRDFSTAIHAFDSALSDADHRPWHRAYIAERSAKFMLAHGLDHAGWSLLVEARELYRSWGARAKVDQLDRAYPSLDVATGPATGHSTRRSSITAGAIDMVGILAAARALSSETSVSGLRAKVVEVLSAMTGATDVGLLLWDNEHRRWVAATDSGDGAAASNRLPHSIIRYVDRTGEALIVGDATRDDRFSRDPYFADLDVCSVLAAPVISRGTLQAILLLENHLLRDAFPAERLEAVVLVAGQLAVSLDNALIYTSLERKVTERTQQLALANERLAHLSITDPLTGVANRRRMSESLQEEWQRARRTGAPLSLAMIDIDHFKIFNDRHGHRAGDRCLQRIATQLNRTVRDIDLVARYGGEEFAIIMSDTASAAAWEAAERVRIAIVDLAEPLTDDQVVTASIGVATLYDAERQTTDQLIERADAALYRAKRTGRNRVCSADVDAPPGASG